MRFEDENESMMMQLKKMASRSRSTNTKFSFELYLVCFSQNVAKNLLSSELIRIQNVKILLAFCHFPIFCHFFPAAHLFYCLTVNLL